MGKVNILEGWKAEHTPGDLPIPTPGQCPDLDNWRRTVFELTAPTAAEHKRLPSGEQGEANAWLDINGSGENPSLSYAGGPWQLCPVPTARSLL